MNDVPQQTPSQQNASPETPPLQQAPARWTRIIHEGRPVGYCRTIGQTVMYSVDGYSWSGTAIEHDLQVSDTRLRDVKRGRVFHGDVVRMALSKSQRTLVEVVVLEHPKHGTLIWQPKLDRLLDLDTLWPPPLRPTPLHIVAHVSERPTEDDQVEEVLARWRPIDPNATLSSTRLAASSVLGSVAATGLQVAIVGTVGPVATWMGMLAGAFFYFWRSRDVRPSRAVMLGTAAWGAFKAGAICAALFGIAVAAGWLSVKNTPATLFVLGIASTFGAGVAHVLAGDLIVWRGGGYGGE
ncbi:MAG: hypothetical protein ACI9U2_003619 [Bradymonadia bacterium]|jgi:hypothetical protein